jgi:valine--pyruvate aminotransferase
MEDLGDALGRAGDVFMLGGGNPAHIPEVEDYFRAAMARLLESPGQFERAVGDYDPPQGNKAFIAAVADLLRGEFGWDITSRNVALTNGSQSAFFILFNAFGGAYEDGSIRRILLPLAPEYIGYTDVGLTDDLFVASRPDIEHLDKHMFKYHVNFEQINVTDEIGAICVSRPTNPTGNLLTYSELKKLSELASAHKIPMIIDGAYGAPFPHIVFTDAEPLWNEDIILCMSLSKLGLPATRTGIVVANEQVIRLISEMNAVMSLAPGSLGAALGTQLVRDGQLMRLSREVIMPFYQKKATQAVEQLLRELADFDFHIHKPEGAFFLWLWFRGLPIADVQLYERLKKRGVVVVPGRYFFPGLKNPWRHKYECIRLSYAQDGDVVATGLHIVAEEVRRAYSGG